MKNIMLFYRDECGLFFKLMPDISYILRGERCYNGELSKERITVLVAANSDGSEKLPLVVVGKQKQPPSFIPCVYHSQLKAWMTTELFVAWVMDLDNRMVQENRKILLFVDNCLVHPKNVSLKNIELSFLPVKTTSALQGITTVLKRFYRKRIVLHFLHGIGPVNMLDALNYLCAAWQGVPPQAIVHCFKKAGISKGPASEPNNIPMMDDGDEDWRAVQEKLGDVHVEDFVLIDDDIVTSEILGVKELIRNHEDEESDEEKEVVENVVPSRAQALAAVTLLRKYVGASPSTVTSAIYSNLILIENAIIYS